MLLALALALASIDGFWRSPTCFRASDRDRFESGRLYEYILAGVVSEVYLSWQYDREYKMKNIFLLRPIPTPQNALSKTKPYLWEWRFAPKHFEL